MSRFPSIFDDDPDAGMACHPSAYGAVVVMVWAIPFALIAGFVAWVLA